MFNIYELGEYLVILFNITYINKGKYITKQKYIIINI